MAQSKKDQDYFDEKVRTALEPVKEEAEAGSEDEVLNFKLAVKDYAETELDTHIPWPPSEE